MKKKKINVHLCRLSEDIPSFVLMMLEKKLLFPEIFGVICSKLKSAIRREKWSNFPQQSKMVLLLHSEAADESFGDQTSDTANKQLQHPTCTNELCAIF